MADESMWREFFGLMLAIFAASMCFLVMAGIIMGLLAALAAAAEKIWEKKNVQP